MSAPDAYHVEVDREGCSCCGAGKLWMVFGPDGVGLGTSYSDETEANIMAEALSKAHETGRLSAPQRRSGDQA